MSAVVARLLALALLVGALGGCDDGVMETALLFGGDLEVATGVERAGSVVVLDGAFTLAAGASLAGPLVVLGGTARVDGRVVGDVVAISGTVALGPSATVGGDLAVAGALERDPGAVVAGAVTVGPAVAGDWASRLRSGPIGWRGLLGRAVGLALAVVLFARFAPRATARLEEAALRHPLPALALGSLAFVVGVVLVVVMAFTVVLIPVSLLALVAGVGSVALGWGVLAIAVAALLRRWWRRGGGPGGAQEPRSVTAAVAAAGGALVGVTLGMLEHVPFVGGVVALAATALGLGALLLTGFGARRFVPEVVDG